MHPFRVGFGFDVHQLVEGREFWLGGVKIDSPIGALGHSDADVLLHAICDALLGAAGLKDIGYYFPDTKAEFKGADSKDLLRQVVVLIEKEGYKVGNVDSTLVLESPKIGKYVDEMKTTIAGILKIGSTQISVKATTNETMGFIGRNEGVVAHAVALIYNET